MSAESTRNPPGSGSPEGGTGGLLLLLACYLLFILLGQFIFPTTGFPISFLFKALVLALITVSVFLIQAVLSAKFRQG